MGDDKKIDRSFSELLPGNSVNFTYWWGSNSNGSQIKNPDISGALYTLRIQYSYTQTQFEDGARDVRVL